jgi:hypothetical protein
MCAHVIHVVICLGKTNLSQPREPDLPISSCLRNLEEKLYAFSAFRYIPSHSLRRVAESSPISDVYYPNSDHPTMSSCLLSLYECQVPYGDVSDRVLCKTGIGGKLDRASVNTGGSKHNTQIKIDPTYLHKAPIYLMKDMWHIYLSLLCRSAFLSKRTSTEVHAILHLLQSA